MPGHDASARAPILQLDFAIHSLFCDVLL